MNQKINPIVGVIIAIAAVAAVGFVSMKLFASNAGVAPSQIARPNNPADPHFKPDPKLAGGGGEGN